MSLFVASGEPQRRFDCSLTGTPRSHKSHKVVSPPLESLRGLVKLPRAHRVPRPNHSSPSWFPGSGTRPEPPTASPTLLAMKNADRWPTHDLRRQIRYVRVSQESRRKKKAADASPGGPIAAMREMAVACGSHEDAAENRNWPADATYFVRTFYAVAVAARSPRTGVLHLRSQAVQPALRRESWRRRSKEPETPPTGKSSNGCGASTG